MVGFIDDHREKFGVEPICAVLPIAPSLYYELKARDRDPHLSFAKTSAGGQVVDFVNPDPDTIPAR